ncbi:MAG: KOW domain-containing RNA-binding protein [Clostridia bacterium]|nr:KOW domain-containing RNA-binding protein [Clostridia bacterium]
MNRIPIESGRVVWSKAGRDAGRPFIVLTADDTFAYTVDGELRCVESPKKKKLRHLRPTPLLFPSIPAILKDGKIPSNAEIRKLLSDRQQTEG